MEDQKQEELERKYQFLFEGFPHNYIYKVKDFNTFAGQKIRFFKMKFWLIFSEISIEGFKKPMEEIENKITISKKQTEDMLKQSEEVQKQIKNNIQEKIILNLLQIKSKLQKNLT
jgi:hypothetical protein